MIMISCVSVLAIICLWLVKTTSLPKLYYLNNYYAFMHHKNFVILRKWLVLRNAHKDNKRAKGELLITLFYFLNYR